jgi:hypothetical protein
MLTSPVVPCIKHEQMLEAIRILGIEPNDVKSLLITRHYVEVTLLVRNEDGKRCAAGNDVATAVTQIPIVDNMWEKEEVVVTGNGGVIAAATDVT